MGIFTKEDTHGSRSSSMTYALRWKRQNGLQILGVALFVVAVVTMVLLGLYAKAEKQIVLVVDGKAQTLTTHKGSLQEFLNEHSVSTKPQDDLSMSLGASIQDGDQISITTAVPVTLAVDEKKETRYTTEKTVGAALKSWNVKLGEFDKISVPVASAVPNGGEVAITTAFPVDLTIDGKTEEAYTAEATVGDALESWDIEVGKHDKISKPLESAIQEGDEVKLNTALPVELTVGGEKTETAYTTERTVGEALKDWGVKLGENDKVYPSESNGLTENISVSVNRISKFTVDQEVTIPYQTVKKEDSSLLKGKTKTVQKGVEGVVVQTIEKVYQNGEYVTKHLVDKETKTEKQNEIIAVGTKEPVVEKTFTTAAAANTSSGDKGFEYKKVLTGVSATAYSSQEPGIGTRTATGTTVTEGRTIAVDPNVIPLGWWVYIEGYGYRKAEDTGSAIKGKKIDIYYDSLGAALNFGRKSGLTIYVIGPNKP
ncbi:ubiquitin-like domain-containing protein [Saccharibacillus sp. CPCC 101409]|uniref:3D domain-containing protein n=1 Tax=Saccharibacillus sp. CPCC 101409 TaxID=3058041 RepID=UPI0026730BE3|nr:3D domain-containing protein [Saccharibacillus sp. CPCC 101409]MDO3412915.1 ubiquitin-like domain-containing protein [Saccharibacillus sp. CPCC 101409]